MTILGIDPGTSILGYAVIRKEADGRATLLEAHSIQPKKTNAADRLLAIHRAVITIIDIHRPQCIALEKIFFSKNIKTALRVAEARGVLLLTAKEKNIRVFEYTPSEVKLAVAGYGKADKQQVKHMAERILKVASLPNLDDVTDAIAIALTAFRERPYPSDRES